MNAIVDAMTMSKMSDVLSGKLAKSMPKNDTTPFDYQDGVMQQVPRKTSKGSLFIEKPKRFSEITISVQLRRLLILIDGERSINELLNQGIRGIDQFSFETLLNYDLIEMLHQAGDKPKSVGYTQELKAFREKGLTAARFAMLDVLIDLSMSDFSLRPWIERFETATSPAHLNELIDELAQSEVNDAYPSLCKQLRHLLT